MSYTPFYGYQNYGAPQQVVQPYFQQMQQVPQQNIGLNGKMVDGIDVVRATDIPIGGYGIFPKADFSEIYIKSWNNNGTTSVMAFKPVQESPQKDQQMDNTTLSEILSKVSALESKIDEFMK